MNSEQDDGFIKFLKQETFYLLVLLLVAVPPTIMYLAAVFSDGELPASERLSEPLDQKELRYHLLEKAQKLSRRQLSEIASYHIDQLLSLTLLYAGMVTFVALLILKFMRMHDPDAAAPPSVLPEPRWGLWDCLKAYVLYVGVGMLLRWILPRSMVRPFALPTEWFGMILGSILLVGVVIHVTVTERNGRLSDLGIRRGWLRGTGMAVVALLTIFPVMKIISALQFDKLEKLPMPAVSEALLLTSSPMVLILGAISTVLIAPVTEELFYRGFLMPALYKWTGKTGAIVMSAAFFAVVHFDIYALPQLFVLGLALGYVYYRSRTLIAPIVLHALFNLLTFISLLAWRSVLYA